MKLKKLITAMLVVVIFTLQFSFVQFNNKVYASQQEAESQNSEKFHYKQLTQEAKNIYNAMYEMYQEGILKTGTQTYDLAEHGYFTQEELQQYANGSKALTTAMDAARYAFYADYPEIFYVNFQKLRIRVTKDAQNKYHANLGSGSLKDYYLDGFTSKEQVEEAVTEFNERVEEIANGAKNLQIEEGKNREAEQIKYVHNEIINNTSYRLESDCTPGNEEFIATPYGALVKKQAVCEGYARALKAVLDKVGITCILVQGTHQNDDSAAIPHMWNYVQIETETNARSRSVEKVWYAVDATMDDPFLRTHVLHPEEMQPGDDIVEGFENTKYCLVGANTMKNEHLAIETVEAAGNYEFKYPELSYEDHGTATAVKTEGLVVKYKEDGTQTEEYTAGDYYISYNGKGYIEAAKEGKYIMMKSHYYKPADGTWQISPWAYFIPDVYAGGFKDNGDYIYVSIANSEYVEIAVTTLAPGDYESDPKYLAYQGDESDIVAQTGKMYNPSGTFKARPYIKEQSPEPTATLDVGKYHVRVVYDDDLLLAEGATEAGYKITSTGPTGAEKTKITNFNFDGKRKIEFDIEFSKMYADDNVMYKIYITGLVGKNSGKTPYEISYGANNPILCNFRMNQARNWEVFARPSLIESEDLSMNGWQTSDGESVSDKLKSRIALVTTRTTTQEKEAMNNLMQNEVGSKEIVKSETYNISLNVCKQYVVKTGHRLKLSLGFPEGYGPEDAGVTFKAYHFKRNDKNEVIGVEEIPCVVTPYGLVVTCDSFSPFAVAVVEKDGTEDSKKYAVASSSEGGVINGADRDNGNIFGLSENEERTISVQANEGYQIETVTIAGEEVDMTQVENKDKMDITVSYNDLKEGNGIINATFTAKSVIQEEEQKGQTVVVQQAVPVEIKMPKTELVATINKEVKLTPTVTETEGSQTYQWFKDGVALAGQTSKTLSIIPTSVEDSGAYTLKVTTLTQTSATQEVTSEPCNIIVKAFEIAITPTDPTANLQKLEPGSEFEVDVEMNNLKNIEDGLISLTGQLEYDTNILERKEIVGQGGWNLTNNDFNEQNFKFVIDSDKLVTEQGDIFKIKFKVKDTITQEVESTIKLKGISASGGNGLVVAEDAELKIGITMPEEEEEEKITSEKYVINDEDKDISRIAPKTTVAQFKSNVTTKQNIVILDKEGNQLTDNDVIGTGMTIKVGKTLQYTLVVTGDIDGTKVVDINDLARIKLHLIDHTKLQGIELKAADVDNDGEITINDVAQVKLVIIGLFEIE